MRNRSASIHRQRADVKPAASQAGFTVIETMVSLAIFTIVLGAVYGMLQLGRNGKLNTMQRWEVLQNARIGLNFLGRDALNAGVGYPNAGAVIPANKLSIIGVPVTARATPDFLTPVYAGNAMWSVNGTLTDQVTFLYVDDTFNGGTSIPISAIADPGTGAPTTLTIQAGSNNTPCNIGDIYLISGLNGGALGMLTGTAGTDTLNFGNTDPLGINNPGVNSDIVGIQTPASIQRVKWSTYWVNDEDGAGPAPGTLERRVYGGFNSTNQTMVDWVDQPIVFGVTNFTVQYVLVDGTVIPAPTAPQMQNIRQVQVTITVRSPDRDPQTNLPFVNALTTTFSTRNLDYEKL